MSLIIIHQVAGHLKRAVENDPVGDLLGQGRGNPAFGRGQAVPDFEPRVTFDGTVLDIKDAGRVVHRAGQQAGIGQDFMMGRIDAGAPGIPLHAAGTFPGHEIRPGPADARGLDRLMGIDHDLPRSCLLGHFLVMPDAVLAVVVMAGQQPARITGLQVMDAIGRRPVQGRIQLAFIVQDIAAGFVVKDIGNAFGIGIPQDLIEIEIRRRLREIERFAVPPGLPAVIPAFEKHTVHVVGCGEINIPLGILRGGTMPAVIVPGLDAQVHSPPDADIFRRLDPGDVFDGTRFIEVQDQGRIDQSDRLPGNLHRPPGSLERLAYLRFGSAVRRAVASQGGDIGSTFAPA